MSDWNVGFCMAVYDPKTCGDCLSEKDCLEMQKESREQEEKNASALQK